MSYGSEGKVHYRVVYEEYDRNSRTYPVLLAQDSWDFGFDKTRAEWEYGRISSEYAGKLGSARLERTLEFPIGSGDTLPDTLELSQAGASWELRGKCGLTKNCRLNNNHYGKCAK